MKRERGILISVVTAALVMVLLCIFFTSDRAVSVKKLKKCVPESVHVLQRFMTKQLQRLFVFSMVDLYLQLVHQNYLHSQISTVD